MSDSTVNNPTIVRAVGFPSDSATWVGPGPKPGTVCVGFDDGRFRLFNLQLQPITAASEVFGSGEAINGVVMFDDFVAVTTRGSVEAHEMPQTGRIYSAERGAFGIASSGESAIVASMGPAGLLYVKNEGNDRWLTSTIRLKDIDIHFYQTVFLSKDASGRQMFASACRNDGLAFTTIGSGRTADQNSRHVKLKMSQRPLKEDFIGICRLNMPQFPDGIAALDVNGTVNLASDISSDQFVELFDLPIDGTPDSIQCAQGHLFLLSSDRLYAFKDIIYHALADGDKSFQPLIKSFAVDAVDFAVIDNHQLVVIDSDRVFAHPINAIFESVQGWDVGRVDQTFPTHRIRRELQSAELLGVPLSA